MNKSELTLLNHVLSATQNHPVFSYPMVNALTVFVLSDASTLTTTFIRDRTGLGQNYCANVLRTLEIAGCIRFSHRNGNREKLWSLTDQGRFHYNELFS